MVMSPARSNDIRQPHDRSQAGLKPDRLAPGSLYIVTQPLINGRFHWSLLSVDLHGSITQYQWHEYHGGRTAEKYSAQHIERTSSIYNGINVLAYFKIGGYRHIDQDHFDECCREVFKWSYGTVQENRAHDITPKTWLLRVLDQFVTGGVIVRFDTVQDLEYAVATLSRYKERQFLEAFLKQQPYIAPVMEL
ncbi:Ubiquitin-like protease family profile domain-containing protein [Pleurotus pulmonarius]|nr:hypothetical protein EYR36_005814 [Pleurotus pulmonarius]KAF4600538.1 hypothetical protein EYR38_005167 [Pleurotus pulmonarius]